MVLANQPLPRSWQSIEVPAEIALVVPSLEALLVNRFGAEFSGAFGKNVEKRLS
jgi:hypothetical protein